MAGTLQIKRPIVMTGGVAGNRGDYKGLEEGIEGQIQFPEEPQIVGKLGTALSTLKLPSEPVRNPKGNDG